MSECRYSLKSNPDVYTFLAIWIVSFNIFLRAKHDFSYDFICYIRYLYAIGDLTNKEIFLNIVNNFPYINLSKGSFEIGFGLVSWALMDIFNNPSIVYAIIGSTSIVARIFALRAFNINWIWIFILNIYTITLFEANAIRLGCAFTLLLFGILFLSRQCNFLSILFFGLAAFFHLQSIFFSAFFVLIFYGYKNFTSSRSKLFLLIILFVLLAPLFYNFFSDTLISRISLYTGKSSDATGVNFISILSVLVLTTYLFQFIYGIKSNLRYEDFSIIFFPLLLSTIPSLLMFVFATNLGAIGDRLWQLSFSLIASFALVGRVNQISKLNIFIAKGFLFLLMFFSIVNVTFRYPLSNFFYPILRYNHINTFIYKYDTGSIL